MHANKIVHRDIKPGNCLIDDKFQLNIIDFGIAIDRSQTLEDGRIMGTPFFMAPEIFKSSGAASAYGEAVDIWACGVMLFQLISGRCPF